MSKKNQKINVEALENENLNVMDLKNKKSKASLENYNEDVLSFIEGKNASDFIKNLFQSDSDLIGKKYDEERESKVYEGLKLLETIKFGENEFPKSFIEICKWWEHKGVRNNLKSILDEEASAKGLESYEYIQNYIGGMVEELKELQQAINRMRYVVTFFKPRGEVKTNKNMIDVRIDGVLYSVPALKLQGLKNLYQNDKETLKSEILKIAKEKNVEDILEL